MNHKGTKAQREEGRGLTIHSSLITYHPSPITYYLLPNPHSPFPIPKKIQTKKGS
jgi:hypothetical protein